MFFHVSGIFFGTQRTNKIFYLIFITFMKLLLKTHKNIFNS